MQHVQLASDMSEASAQLRISLITVIQGLDDRQ
jgi:hypothetical protein